MTRPLRAEIDAAFAALDKSTAALRRFNASCSVVTHYDPKPIPDRRFDWSAVDGETYDGPGCPIGWGRTEDEARADLAEQMEDE